MPRSYDALIIGSGNAGMAAASAVKQAGKSVAIIEHGDPGGVCPTRGCVPKKVLVAASQTLHQIDLAAKHGIHVDGVSLNWKELVTRKQTFVDGVPDDFAASLKNKDIDLLRGEARFVSDRRLQIESDKGREEVEAASILIATGSTPRPLPIEGAEHLMTSDDLLNMTTLPGSVVFIGGGVIALEFAHILARAGVKICILEAAEEILPQQDSEVVRVLRTETEALGIDIQTNVRISKIEQHGRCLRTTYEENGRQFTMTSDYAVNGAGRIANIAGLKLETGGVTTENGAIVTTPHLQSVSNRRVFVAGDALTRAPQLSPVASHEGRIAAHNMLYGNDKTVDYSFIPSGIYTTPAFASVGLTEAQADARGVKVIAKTNDMTGWRSAMTYAETAAFSKVLIGEEDGLIKGAHLIGHGAEEIIHLFAFAMQHYVSAEQLQSTVYAYPTFSSDIKFMV